MRQGSRVRPRVRLGAGLLAVATVLFAPEAWAEDLLKPQGQTAAQRYRLEQLAATHGVSDFDISPDGKQIAFVADITGVRQIWTVPFEGGWPHQVTFGTRNAADPRFSPDSRQIAFVADTDGDERNDIYLVSAEGGEAENLTQDPAADDRQPRWSPSGKHIAFVSSRVQPGNYQVYIMEMAASSGRGPRPVQVVTKAAVSSMLPCWSPDGRMLAVTRSGDHATGEVVVVTLGTGLERVVSPALGPGLASAHSFTSDGKVVITAPSQDGFMQVAVADPQRQSLAWVTRERYDSAQPVALAGSSQDLAWIVNVDGEGLLRRGGPGRGAQLLGPRHGLTSGVRAAPRARRFALRWEGSTRPADIWVGDLRQGRLRQVTFSQLGGVRAEHLVEAQLVRYPSFDARRIPAWAYVPHGLPKMGRAPALIWLHSGPSGQHRPQFDYGLQHLANLGFVVLAPNVRGSTGYGRDYEDLNNRDWGGADLRDVEAAYTFLLRSGYVDPKRVAVGGPGYGGYLALLAAQKLTQPFAAVIDLGAPTNLMGLAKATRRDLDRYLEREMGKFESDPALFRDRSPLNFVERLKVPVLVLHGSRDPRVPKPEVDEFVGACRLKHVEVEYHVYPDEGHTFRRKENVRDAMRRVVDFVSRLMPPAK